jgi:hypothetical protein
MSKKAAAVISKKVKTNVPKLADSSDDSSSDEILI